MALNAKYKNGMVPALLGLLWSFFQPVLAAPGKGEHLRTGDAGRFYSYTFSPIKDYQLVPNGVDVLEVTVSPTPPPNTQISISLGGSTSLVATTDANGNAFFYFRNATPGTVTVTINDAGGNAVGTIDMHFLAAPNPPDPSKSFFYVYQDNANANGVAQDIVVAQLYDKYGNPISGSFYNTAVDWTLSGGVPASWTSNPNSTTNNQGLSVMDLTSLMVGAADVTAIASYTDPSTGNPVTFQLHDQSAPPNNTLTVHFVQPQPDLTQSYIVAVIPSVLADGSSQDEVQAHVNDAQGVPIASGTITFTIETGSATIIATGTIVNGIATAYFTDNTVETVPVQAQVLINGVLTYLNDQAQANNFVDIQFTPPPINTTSSYITAVTTPVPADGASKDEVDAIVVTTTGQPTPDGTVVTFTIETGTAVMTTTGVTVNGVAKAYFTSTTPGPVQVQAQVTTGGSTVYLEDQPQANNYVTINFTILPVYLPNSYIKVTQNPATADGVAQDVVTAYLFDSLGNPAAGPDTLTFSVTSPASVYNAATQIITNGVTGGEFVSPVIGADTVHVQVMINGVAYTLSDKNTGNPYSAIQFIAGQPVPGNAGGGGAGGTNPGGGGIPPGGGGSGSTGPGNNTGPGSNSGYTVLFVTQDHQLSDGTQQDSVIAYITDAKKNPVSGVTVTFFIQTTPTAGTISSGVQIAGNASPATDASGMARIAITSSQPGTAYVDATIVDPATGNTVLIDGSYQIVTFVTKPDNTNPLTALIVVVPEALADGLQQTEVKAHVVDLTGAVMPNQPVTFSIDSGSGTIVTPQPVLTDANGDAYIQITSKTPGDVLITATVDGVTIINGSPARVHFAGINIYVPRVFTPNNDGTNDLLKPILVGISDFHYFTVYNRWGNIVFTTQDPNQGWDGTFKGVPQPVETYLWIAEGIDNNGRKIVSRGMTSLVR